MSTLWSFAIVTSIALFAIAPSAGAQRWRPSTAGYNTTLPTIHGAPIDRATLERILRMSGGVDENGYFRRPLRVTPDVYKGPVDDGLHEHPMDWEPQNSIVLEVRNGQVIRQDYILRE